MLIRLRTYCRLGVLNLIRVGTYRMLLKLNLHPVQRLKNEVIKGHFFEFKRNIESNEFSLKDIKEGFKPFGGQYISFLPNPHPNWHKNYFNQSISSFSNTPWWKIPDFDSALGDIKSVWELSRFDWVVQLAVIGTTEAVNLLNDRLNDWSIKNPPYLGINWKCGQEASIRVMHLITAFIILNNSTSPTKSLKELIKVHLERIYPTISYALSQQNNHGTSEAAALFVGGHFINELKYYQKGRNLLEKLSATLFFRDGCFSQYSNNYHRMVLDTYNFVEAFRLKNNLPEFLQSLKNTIINALEWLAIQIDNDSGDVPNYGPNDGARLFPYKNTPYRDYRPTIQWGTNVWNNKISDFPNILKTIKKDNKVSIIKGNKSGIFIFRDSNILLLFRRPKYNFRPKQADALHIDLWVKGNNILRSPGSFSYYNNVDQSQRQYSNNVILFDGKDQMPKISRFLYGDWLIENDFSFKIIDEGFILKSSFTNQFGCEHIRELIYNYKNVEIIDKVSGPYKTADLTWRLNSSNWVIKNSIGDNNEIHIDLCNSTLIGKFDLKTGFESKVYMEKIEVPMIEKNISESKFLKTKIIWN